jgi:hypothetical protein
MKRCLVYQRSRTCPHAWRQCKNPAHSGGFCSAHLRVISGIYMGLELAEVPRRRRATMPETDLADEPRGSKESVSV